MSKHSTTIPGVIECLEAKLAPAGQVFLTISGGILTITGDGNPNGIIITDDPVNNQWDISDSLAGTQFVVNNVIQAAPFSIAPQQGIKAVLGGGDDDIQIIGSTTNNGFILPKGININSGEGNDNLDIGTSGTQNFIIGTGFAIDMGAGNDTFDFDASATFLSAVKIVAGVGNDNVDFQGSGVQVLTKGLSVDLGAGDDDFDILAADFSVTGGGITVKTAGGVGLTPTFSIGSARFSSVGAVSMTVLAGDTIMNIGTSSTDILYFGAGFKVTGGTGNDQLLIEGQMQSNGAVVVDLKAGKNTLFFNDNSSLRGTALSMIGLAGDDTFRLDPNYSLQLTGLLNINLGAGASNTFLANAGSNLTAGSLTYTGTTGVDKFTFTGSSMTVNGAMNFLLGDANNELNLSPTTSLFVGGSLSVTSLNGGDLLDINTPLVNILGSLTLKLGNGDNDTDIAGTTFRVGNAMTYLGGTGNDLLDILNNEIFIQNAFNFNGGTAGSNSAFLRPVIGNIGSVVYTGGSGSDLIALGDVFGDSTTRLVVNGNVTTAMAGGNASFLIRDTVVQGSLGMTSSALAPNTEGILVIESTLNGAVKFNQGAGLSDYFFGDTIVRGNVDINAGAGDNDIELDAGGGTSSLSQWFGTVKIITGAGVDTIRIGSNPVVANAGNIFYKLITVDNDAGADVFSQGNNTFVGGSSFP